MLSVFMSTATVYHPVIISDRSQKYSDCICAMEKLIMKFYVFVSFNLQLPVIRFRVYLQVHDLWRKLESEL